MAASAGAARARRVRRSSRSADPVAAAGDAVEQRIVAARQLQGAPACRARRASIAPSCVTRAARRGASGSRPRAPTPRRPGRPSRGRGAFAARRTHAGQCAAGRQFAVGDAAQQLFADVEVRGHRAPASYDASLLMHDRTRQFSWSSSRLAVLAGCGEDDERWLARAKRAPVILATTTSTATPACSMCSSPLFEARPATRSRRSRSAAVRRSRWANAARPTSCSPTPRRQRRMMASGRAGAADRYV